MPQRSSFRRDAPASCASPIRQSRHPSPNWRSSPCTSLAGPQVAHRQRSLQRNALGVPTNLVHLGVVTRLPFAKALAAANDADQLVTPTSTAAGLVFFHPQLATSDPATAAAIMDDHINSSDNLDNIERFQGVITRQGPNWQATVPSADKGGNPLVWGPRFANKGKPVYNHRLSDATIAGSGAAMRLPLTTSQQDPALENSSWSVKQGTGSVCHVAPGAVAEQRAGRALEGRTCRVKWRLCPDAQQPDARARPLDRRHQPGLGGRPENAGRRDAHH